MQCFGSMPIIMRIRIQVLPTYLHLNPDFGRDKKQIKLGKFIKEMFNYNLFVMLVFLAWYRYM